VFQAGYGPDTNAHIYIDTASSSHVFQVEFMTGKRVPQVATTQQNASKTD